MPLPTPDSVSIGVSYSVFSREFDAVGVAVVSGRDLESGRCELAECSLSFVATELSVPTIFIKRDLGQVFTAHFLHGCQPAAYFFDLVHRFHFLILIDAGNNSLPSAAVERLGGGEGIIKIARQ